MAQRKDKIITLDISELHEFKNHPFKVEDNKDLHDLMDSIRDNGIITPIMARQLEDGTYEIVSGHRRTEACRKLGIEKIPVVVRDLTDDQAIIAMVDANLQREQILPSEKAFAYKMKFEALSHQGKKLDAALDQVGLKEEDATMDQVGPKHTIDAIADGDSPTQVKRYIRLTQLIPELLELVDKKKMAMGPAVSISFLQPNQQRILLDAMAAEDRTPSITQANELKRLSQENELHNGDIYRIMKEEKSNEIEYIRLPVDELREIMHCKNGTVQEITKYVIKDVRDKAGLLFGDLNEYDRIISEILMEREDCLGNNYYSPKSSPTKSSPSKNSRDDGR